MHHIFMSPCEVRGTLLSYSDPCGEYSVMLIVDRCYHVWLPIQGWAHCKNMDMQSKAKRFSKKLTVPFLYGWNSRIGKL